MVGFEVETSSIDASQVKIDAATKKCTIDWPKLDQQQQAGGGRSAAMPQKLVIGQTNRLHMTYEIVWKESEIPWASRWDSYLKMSDVQIHWFSIINSLVVVFFLAGILSMILLRSLRRDIAKYNREDEPVI